MKRHIVFSTIIICAIALLTGCGISKAEYYDAVKESSDLRAQLVAIQEDLAATRQNLTSVTDERDMAKSELEKKGDSSTELAVLKDNLSASQLSLSTFKANVKEHELYVQVGAAYFAFAAVADSGAQNDIIVAFGNIETTVSATQDTDMKDTWKAVWDASADNQNTDAPMAAFVKLLGQRLTDTKPRTN